MVECRFKPPFYLPMALAVLPMGVNQYIDIKKLHLPRLGIHYIKQRRRGIQVDTLSQTAPLERDKRRPFLVGGFGTRGEGGSQGLLNDLAERGTSFP